MLRELESARLTVVPWDTPFEILKGTYTHHRFAPHLHDTFGLGAIEAGASKIRYRGRTVSQRAGDVVHVQHLIVGVRARAPPDPSPAAEVRLGRGPPDVAQ